MTAYYTQVLERLRLATSTTPVSLEELSKLLSIFNSSLGSAMDAFAYGIAKPSKALEVFDTISGRLKSLQPPEETLKLIDHQGCRVTCRPFVHPDYPYAVGILSSKRWTSSRGRPSTIKAYIKETADIWRKIGIRVSQKDIRRLESQEYKETKDDLIIYDFVPRCHVSKKLTDEKSRAVYTECLERDYVRQKENLTSALNLLKSQPLIGSIYETHSK